jgi:hypothetical protein
MNMSKHLAFRRASLSSSSNCIARCVLQHIRHPDTRIHPLLPMLVQTVDHLLAVGSIPIP